MAFPMFDTSRLHIKPLAERIHDVDLLQVLIPVDDSPAPMENERPGPLPRPWSRPRRRELPACSCTGPT